MKKAAGLPKPHADAKPYTHREIRARGSENVIAQNQGARTQEGSAEWAQKPAIGRERGNSPAQHPKALEREGPRPAARIWGRGQGPRAP